MILNVQPPYKPPFKEAGSVLTIPLGKESQKPPLSLLGQRLSPVGVGRLRLWRQRGRSGKPAGGELGSARGHLPGGDPGPEDGMFREKSPQKFRRRRVHSANASVQSVTTES